MATTETDQQVRWLSDAEQVAWRNWISGTTVLFRALERELVQHFDITMDDYALLVLLSESEHRSARMSELADDAIVPRPQVTYRISRLEKRGFVERLPGRRPPRPTSPTRASHCSRAPQRTTSPTCASCSSTSWTARSSAPSGKPWVASTATSPPATPAAPERTPPRAPRPA